MPYICEDELQKIYSYIEPEFNKVGLQSEIALIRDYMLKVSVIEGDTKLGKLIIDYSPKKQTYSYRRDSDLSEEQYNRIVSLITGQVGMNVTASSSIPLNSTGTRKPAKEKSPEDNIDYNALSTQYQAYVDGSFIDSSIGYGSVILNRGEPTAELCGKVDDPDAFSSRQVGGEIKAVIETLEWCKKNDIKEITIFFDFRNIEKWATGEFKTNTPMTQEYKRYIDSCGIRIDWHKVESHTGIALNDRADELAKMGARGITPALPDIVEFSG